MSRYGTIRNTAIAAILVSSASIFAQNPTATGTINATLVNKSGISLVFDSDPAGVALGNNGSSAASLNFGVISAFGPLAAGLTRPAVGANSYTVSTLFDVQVIQAGSSSPNYTLNCPVGGCSAHRLQLRGGFSNVDHRSAEHPSQRHVWHGRSA